MTALRTLMLSNGCSVVLRLTARNVAFGVIEIWLGVRASARWMIAGVGEKSPLTSVRARR